MTNRNLTLKQKKVFFFLLMGFLLGLMLWRQVPVWLCVGFALVFGVLFLKGAKEKFERLSEKADLSFLKSEKLSKELEMAKRVQQGLLSVEDPNITGIRIAKKCVAAESIGGDFYAFVDRSFEILLPKRKIPGVIQYIDSRETTIGIIVGDVAGHGVSSALVMALASGLLTQLAKSVRSPSKVLQMANQILRRYIENSQISYITACYASIDVTHKKMVFSKGGHPPALLYKADEKNLVSLHTEGVFLGMFEEETYEEREWVLATNDKVVFYTDGIVEAKNKSGSFFGLERLEALILQNSHLMADDLLALIFNAVNQFSEGLPAADDQTLVIVDVL